MDADTRHEVRRRREVLQRVLSMIEAVRVAPPDAPEAVRALDRQLNVVHLAAKKGLEATRKHWEV